MTSSSEATSGVFYLLQYLGKWEGLAELHSGVIPTISDISEEQRKFVVVILDCLFCCRASDRQAVGPPFLSYVTRNFCNVMQRTGKFKDFVFDRFGHVLERN